MGSAHYSERELLLLGPKVGDTVGAYSSASWLAASRPILAGRWAPVERAGGSMGREGRWFL